MNYQKKKGGKTSSYHVHAIHQSPVLSISDNAATFAGGKVEPNYLHPEMAG